MVKLVLAFEAQPGELWITTMQGGRREKRSEWDYGVADGKIPTNKRKEHPHVLSTASKDLHPADGNCRTSVPSLYDLRGRIGSPHCPKNKNLYRISRTRI